MKKQDGHKLYKDTNALNGAVGPGFLRLHYLFAPVVFDFYDHVYNYTLEIKDCQ
ncbi:MAG: hypothetical protein QG657_5867 [Acidobacteriota bacterium]|nr:hypothetical protein [Acidobacteriota bacterium]